jgi:hypothetical protein
LAKIFCLEENPKRIFENFIGLKFIFFRNIIEKYKLIKKQYKDYFLYIVYRMELVERLPLDKINFLNSLTFKMFKQLEIYKSSCKNEDERKIQFNILKSFCQTNIKTRGETKRIYSYTEKTPLDVGGRLYCGNSIQGLSTKIRGFLLNGITTDIDMKNAHPVILKYICSLHNLECPNLTYYIENRDTILNRLGKEYKTEFLKAVNSDKTNKKIKDELFKNFDKECKLIQKHITELQCYKHIVNTVPSSREYNWLGSAINRILCVYENKIIQEVISVINSKQMEVCSLMFDGLMIYGNHYEDNELLNKISEYVNNKFEGLNIVFTYKEHSNEIQIPEDFALHETIVHVEGVYDDMGATNKVFELYPHWVFCLDKLFIFDDETGLWNTDKTSYYKIIQRCSDKLFILTKKDGEIIKTNKSYGNTLNLMEKIPQLIKTLCMNNNWLKEKQNSALGKILFNNGYYDFHKELFYSKDEYGFNPDIVFMGKIHFDFEDFDTEYMNDIKQRLFINPLGEVVGNYLLLNLSRGLAGDRMKRILFGLGGTNCGKSILSTAVTLACGDYVGSFNAENLSSKNSSNDEAQIMRWCLLLRYKRLIFSNELKNNLPLNGNAIKKISSGGDTLIGRGHNANEEEFVTDFLAMCMANDLTKITPYDDAVDERLKVINYKRQFVENPSNEFELKMDRNINNEIKSVEFQKALVGLFIQAYMEKDKFDVTPDEVVIGKTDWISNDRCIIDTFKNDFEITNNENDYVISKDIEEWLKANNTGITIKKFGMEMKKYTIIQKLENVDNVRKKIKGKLFTCWVGVKMINCDDVIEESDC